jgi:hypothetical protein
MKDRTDELRTFASSVKNRGIPRVWVLDPTIPSWVRLVTQPIDPN